LAEFDLGQMPQSKPYRLGCKHKFCEGCFEEIISEMKDDYLWCPLCRFKIGIGELRDSDPQMFSTTPKSVPPSSANGSMNFLRTSLNIEPSSYNSSKSIGTGSFTPDSNLLSKSPRHITPDNPQYNTSPNLKSSRKNSGGAKLASPAGNYMTTENYLAKSPTKSGGMGHVRRASTASGTGYITTEAYSSSASNRTSNNSRDSNTARYPGIDEETPLFANEINKWTMVSDTDYLANVAEPRPNVLISVVLSLLLVGMLPALNLFRYYIVDNRFRHPLAVGMLTFATIFIGSSFYFLMRQRRVKKRERKRRKKQQTKQNYGAAAPILSINESVNELFQNRSHDINNTSAPQSSNNVNGLAPKSHSEPSDFFKKFQKISFIFLTCLIMILFFIVSWFSSAWNICGVPSEPMTNVTSSPNSMGTMVFSQVNIEGGESNENLCAIVFGSNTVVLYLVSLIWKRERGSILTLLACLLMAVSVSLLFWEEPFKFEVKFNFQVIYLILMVTEPILFGVYFFVLRKATLLNNGSAKVLFVQSFFGVVCLAALTIVFEGKQPWINLHAGGLPLVCELIVFVMVLSAAVYFIPLICSYSDAITTGFFFQIGWILSDHEFLYPFIIYQTVQWSAPIIICIIGMVLSLAYMTYRIFTIPNHWQQYHLQNKKMAEDSDDSDMEI
jgi:DNA-directed RNA polymerase subunit RPC12/RpoP